MSLYPISFLHDDRNVSDPDARIDSPRVSFRSPSPEDTTVNTDEADLDGAGTDTWMKEQDNPVEAAFYIDTSLTLGMEDTHPLSVRDTSPGSGSVALEYTTPSTPDILTYADLPSNTASTAAPLQHTDTARPTPTPFDPRDPYIPSDNVQDAQATEIILGAFVCLPLEYFYGSEVFEIPAPESAQHNDSSAGQYRTALLEDDDVLLGGPCIPRSPSEGAAVFTSDITASMSTQHNRDGCQQDLGEGQDEDSARCTWRDAQEQDADLHDVLSSKLRRELSISPTQRAPSAKHTAYLGSA